MGIFIYMSHSVLLQSNRWIRLDKVEVDLMAKQLSNVGHAVPTKNVSIPVPFMFEERCYKPSAEQRSS